MLVMPEKRRIVINSDANATVATVIPHAKQIDHGGEKLLAMPYGVEESIVLKNLGFSVPAPILHYYDWPARFSPMEHQKETAAFLTMHRRCLCLNAPGTGKSISSIWAADFLLTEGMVRKVLIIAPLSTLKVVWGRELRHHLPHRSFEIIDGSRTKAKRLELLEKPGLQYVIMNHDCFTNMREHLEGFDVVIYDEATALKTPGSQRFKVFYKWVAQHQPWLWLLTGTPISQSPSDAWTLARLVDSPSVPKSYTTFKDLVMQKVTQFRWVPRPDALETCRRVLQPSIRFSLDECKDLPQTNFVGRKTELTPVQAKAFKEMKEDACVAFAAGEVTAANSAVLLSKLLQITCIAYNTPVLTDAGWIPIQHVRRKHKVWDGVEWVAHGGVVYKGNKHTLSVGGIRMTPDHKVLVDTWVTAQEFRDGYASGSSEWPQVRLPDGVAEIPYTGAPEVEDSALALPLRLWERSCTTKPVPEKRESGVPSKLRVPPRQRDAQNVEDAPAPHMDEHEAEVQRNVRQRLLTLWGQGHHGMRRVAAVVRQLLGGHEGGVRPDAVTRPRGCERPLLQGELSLGDAERAGKQPPRTRMAGHSEGANDYVAGSGSLRDQSGDTACTPDSVWVANSESARPVYDIVNCGPRKRFVVKGDVGKPLIVHNCGVAYADTGPVLVDASHRYQSLTELIDEVGDKVIVFVPLKGVQHWLKEKLVADGYDVALVNGDTSKAERDQIFNDFQHTDSIRVLLAHPKVASHGLTLTRSKDIIWYAPIYSLESYEQANARIRRLSTTGKTTVWHIWATTFEQELYRRLRMKQNTLTEFLNLVQGINSDD